MEPDDVGLAAEREQVVAQQEEEAPRAKEVLEVKRLEDEKRAKLPLKHNGEEMEVDTALIRLTWLRIIIRDRPKYLQALLDIEHGSGEHLSQRALAAIKKDGFLTDDGLALGETFRDVFMSAVESTPDGPVLSTNPFKLRSGRDRLIVEGAQRKAYRSLARLLEMDEVAFNKMIGFHDPGEGRSL